VLRNIGSHVTVRRLGDRGLGSLLSILNFLQSSSFSSGDLLGLGSSSALLLDVIQRGTNNSSGNLDNSSSLLADDTLILTLLVKATPGLGPHQLGRLLAVDKKALALGVGKSNRLSISSDESLTVARVDSVFAEGAKLGSEKRNEKKRKKCK
jgi:hypothetical protein